MKIALLAPPYLSVPPKAYGGTEKIVALLADGLVGKGHEVTLFATGESKTCAKLVNIVPESLGKSGISKADPLQVLLHYEKCFSMHKEFDLIHNHGQYLAMFMAEYVDTPVAHTIHGSYFEGEVPEAKRMVLARFKNHRFISISGSQRQGFPELNYVGTVYNSIDLSEFTFREKPSGNYLLWIGRVAQKKGPLDAIRVSKKLKIPLKIAAAIDPVDKPYFEEVIKPEIDNTLISFIGETNPEELDNLYGNALCTLFPITWHEPFGLVMIESMACGTPVIAYNWGSVPEVIENGVTGFIVENIDEMTDMVGRINEIDRLKCRQRVQKYFSPEVMVANYEKIYQTVIRKA